MVSALAGLSSFWVHSSPYPACIRPAFAPAGWWSGGRANCLARPAPYPPPARAPAFDCHPCGGSRSGKLVRCPGFLPFGGAGEKPAGFPLGFGADASSPRQRIARTLRTFAGRPWSTIRARLVHATCPCPSPSCPRPLSVPAASPSRVAASGCRTGTCSGGRGHRHRAMAARAEPSGSFADLITRPRKILARAGAGGFRDSGRQVLRVPPPCLPSWVGFTSSCRVGLRVRRGSKPPPGCPWRGLGPGAGLPGRGLPAARAAGAAGSRMRPCSGAHAPAAVVFWSRHSTADPVPQGEELRRTLAAYHAPETLPGPARRPALCDLLKAPAIPGGNSAVFPNGQAYPSRSGLRTAPAARPRLPPEHQRTPLITANACG